MLRDRAGAGCATPRRRRVTQSGLGLANPPRAVRILGRLSIAARWLAAHGNAPYDHPFIFVKRNQ